MRTKSCCFIGHRKVEITDELIDSIYSTAEKLILNHNVTLFNFGSKSTFNDICHSVVTELKSKYANLIRTAYCTKSEYACLESERESQEKTISKILDKDIRLLGFERRVTPEILLKSGKASYIKRNEIMINDSDYCVFYYDINASRNSIVQSGTELAYKYAMKQNKTVVNLCTNTR